MSDNDIETMQALKEMGFKRNHSGKRIDSVHLYDAFEFAEMKCSEVKRLTAENEEMFELLDKVYLNSDIATGSIFTHGFEAIIKKRKKKGLDELTAESERLGLYDEE